MPWTTPETFTAGQTLTAASMNAITENTRTLRVREAVIARRNAVQSIPNNTVTAVSFDTQDVDTASMFAPTSTDVTIVTAGIYFLATTVEFAGSATGTRDIGIRKNGTVIDSSAGQMGANTVSASGAFSTLVHSSGLALLAVSDIITVYAWQNTGGALNVRARLEVMFMGATS